MIPAPRVVFASPKIAAGLAGVTDVPVEAIDSPPTPAAWNRRRPSRRTPTLVRWRGCSTPAAPPADQGRDAVAPQSDGDDGRRTWPTSTRRTRIPASCTAHRCRTARALHPALRAARRPAGRFPHRRVSNPTSSSTCATTTPAPAASWRPPWCSAWWRTGRPRPANLADRGLRRRPDVRRQPRRRRWRHSARSSSSSTGRARPR